MKITLNVHIIAFLYLSFGLKAQTVTDFPSIGIMSLNAVKLDTEATKKYTEALESIDRKPQTRQALEQEYSSKKLSERNKRFLPYKNEFIESILNMKNDFVSFISLYLLAQQANTAKTTANLRYIKTKTSKSKTDLLGLTRKYKVRYLIGCSLLEINGKDGTFHGKGSFVLYDSLQKTIRFDNQFSNECERILFLSEKTEQSNSFNVVCSNIFTNAIDSAFVLMSMDLPNGKLCIEHWQKQNKATMAFFEQKPNPSLLKILPTDFVLNTSFVEEEQGLLFQNGNTGQMEDFSNEKQIEPTYRAIIDSLLTPTDLLKRRYLQSVFNTNNTHFIAFFMDSIQYQDAAYPISFAEIVLANRQARPIYRIVQIAGTKGNNGWELTEEIQYDGFAPKSKKAIADIILPLFKDFWTDNLEPNPKFWLQTFPIKSDKKW